MSLDTHTRCQIVRSEAKIAGRGLDMNSSRLRIPRAAPDRALAKIRNNENASIDGTEMAPRVGANIICRSSIVSSQYCSPYHCVFPTRDTKPENTACEGELLAIPPIQLKHAVVSVLTAFLCGRGNL